MIERLKQKLNELRWSLNNLQHGTIQRELYKEFFEALDTIDKEDDEMGYDDYEEKKEETEMIECADISLKRMYLVLLHTEEMILADKHNKREIVSYLSSIEQDILLLNDKENQVSRDLFD